MNYLLFFIYLIVFCVLLTRIRFIAEAGISKNMLLGLFIIKVLCGLLIGWMTATFYPGNDYWELNMHGDAEYLVLISDPATFFSDIFYSPYDDKYGNFFNSVGSYWKDLSKNLIIKCLAIANIITRGNFYTNTLLFNFVGFFGCIALFRVFTHVYVNKKWPILIGCFLLPSTLYFTSGIHKDGIVFTMLSFFCYALYFSVIRHFTFKRIVIITVSALVILLIRNYVFITLVPAAIAFILAKKYGNPLRVFTLVYASIILLVIIISVINPENGPLHIISQKQKDFLDIAVARTQFSIDPIEPTLSSMARNFPSAFERAILKPYIWDFPRHFLLFIAIELLIFQLLVIYILFKKPVHPTPDLSFIYLCVFFALTVVLFSGYIIPNAGSLVRYRSIYLPFLMIPVLCRAWSKNILSK